MAGSGDGSIAEGSRSPDGRFGVLLPPREEAAEQDEEEVKNVLVDLRSHAELAVIEGSHYFAGRNHRRLSVVWGPGSSWCVVTYDGRFGFEAVTLLVNRGSAWEQTNLGAHIKKVLDGEISGQAGKDAPDCFPSATFRAGKDGRIHATASGTTNPKGLPDIPAYDAYFAGLFDPRSGRWIESDASKPAAEAKP